MTDISLLQVVACLGVSEPGGGSDVAACQTTARRVGDDLVINGQKMWITNAFQADWICLLANTEEGPGEFIVTVTSPRYLFIGFEIFFTELPLKIIHATRAALTANWIYFVLLLTEKRHQVGPLMIIFTQTLI